MNITFRPAQQYSAPVRFGGTTPNTNSRYPNSTVLRAEQLESVQCDDALTLIGTQVSGLASGDTLTTVDATLGSAQADERMHLINTTVQGQATTDESLAVEGGRLGSAQANDNIKLKQTTVLGLTESSTGGVEAESSTLSSINTYDDITLIETMVTGSSKTGGDFTATSSPRLGDVTANDGLAFFQNCSQVGRVQGESIQAVGSRLQSAKAKGDLSLTNTIVHNGASAGQAAKINNSTIGGNLTVQSNVLKIQGRSNLNNIILKAPAPKPKDPLSDLFQKLAVDSIGICFDTLPSSSRNDIEMQLSLKGVVQSKGYTARATGKAETTVTTLTGLIYVNGDLKTGDGPATYAAFKKANPEAPTIAGPGWIAEGSTPKPTEQGPPKPTMKIELGESLVRGKIMFKEGFGEVFAHADNPIRPDQIENGTLIKG